MKTNHVLTAFLVLMAGMILAGILFPARIEQILYQPALFGHARFVHILASALFFANATVGMLWERRSLAQGRKSTILDTYATVAWLDARISSPLIVVALVSGLMLGTIMGGVFEIGWLAAGFILFLLSGIFWVASDIPTQAKVRRLTAALEPGDEALPAELVRLLRARWWISLAGLLPLLVVFALMVYQPEIAPPAAWFR